MSNGKDDITKEVKDVFKIYILVRIKHTNEIQRNKTINENFLVQLERQ